MAVSPDGDSVLDALIEGCLRVDRDWRCVYVNEAAARQGHTTREALFGRKLTEVYPHLPSTPLGQDLKACLERGEVIHREAEFTFSDRAVGWFDLRIQPVPEGAFITSIDITERKRALERERATALRYQRLVETTSEGVVTVDLDARITYANAQFAQMLGYSVADLVGHPVFELMDEEAKALAAKKVERRFAGVSERHEHRFRHKCGREVWLRIHSSPLTDRHGRIEGAMALLTDITEAREADVTLRATEAQLRQLRQMDAIGSLAGGIAHEFNNLLSVILGHVDLALEEFVPGGTHRQDLLAVQEAAKRGAALTKQLLAFSKQQTFTPVLIDVSQVVRAMETLLGRVVSDGVTLTLQTDEGLRPVRADKAQLEQVVLNLVVNACDAIKEKGAVTLATSGLRLDAEDAVRHPGVVPGEYVVLTVQDTGAGMDAATQARAFDPFFTTKPIGQGPGLGLSTVYGIVKQSGGHLGLTSTVGQGTTFRIYLPCAAGAR